MTDDDLIARLRQRADATRRALLQERINLYDEAADELERMTPTAAQIELAKDAVAFLDLNGMHLAAGVVRRYVLKE